MKSRHRILDFYASKPWAILEANLQEMYQIYQSALERKAVDLDFNPEAVAAKIGRPLDNSRTVTVRDGIAVLPVSGPIFRYANLFTEISGATSIEVLATDFQQAMDDRTVKAIVLEINSPGGEVDGTSELAQHIYDARGQKPIIAYVGHLGASAAYWLASACDEIVCNDTASLGSIGVVGTVCVHKDKHHIEFVSSQSPNKRPNVETESGRAQVQSHIDTLADVFIETIARNRGMSAEDVINQGGAGGLKVGQQAVAAGLADRIGTLEGVLTELSNPESGQLRSAAENVNQKPVLQLDTDNETLKGANAMAEEKDPKPAADAQPKTDPPKVEAKPVDDTAQLEAAQKAAAETAQQLDAERAANKELSEQVASLQSGVAELQKQARATRFAELVKDWIGESAHHVAMLETLSGMEGSEASKLFTDYVTQQKAAAEQVRTSKIFGELGSSAPAEGSAEAELDRLAKEKAAAEKTTYQIAYDAVMVANPELVKRLRAESN